LMLRPSAAWQPAAESNTLPYSNIFEYTRPVLYHIHIIFIFIFCCIHIQMEPPEPYHICIHLNIFERMSAGGQQVLGTTTLKEA
jgi:hypothetical protein